MDDLVLRSAYLRLSDDMLLRKLAHELNVSKSDLIRAAIHVKLDDWRSANDPDRVMRDLAFRVGEAKAERTVVVKVQQKPKPAPSAKKAVEPSKPTTKQPTKPLPTGSAKLVTHRGGRAKSSSQAEALLPA